MQYEEKQQRGEGSMQSQQLESLREGSTGCPSDLMLDRLHAGELSTRSAQEIEAHVAGCALCPQRLTQRQAGFTAFPDLDARPLLAGIHRRLGQEAEAKARRFSLGRLLAILTPATAVAAMAVFALWGRNPDTQVPEILTTREKGGLALHVFRQVGDGAQEALSGDSFRPGDHLRFVVDLAQRGVIRVLGVESSGALYVAWPQTEGESGLREAGKGQQLPGAVVLDEKLGRETLHLVSCKEGVGSPEAVCKPTSGATQLQCPTDCTQTVFVLNKK